MAANLDKVGAQFDLSRRPHESDAAYRYRINAHLNMQERKANMRQALDNTCKLHGLPLYSELAARSEQVRDEGFTSGVIASMAVATVHDSPTIWRDIVFMADKNKLLQHAKFKEPDDWEFGGFALYCKSELGITKASIRKAKP